MSKYDDIMGLPYPISKKHPQMSMHDRAAQFSPFAALTGFGAAITETARLTQEKIELDEYAKSELDARLRAIELRLAERPEVTVTYYVADVRKSGGAYVTVTGRVRRLDALTQTLALEDGTVIALDDICSLEEREETEA